MARRFTSKDLAKFTVIWFWVNVAVWEALKLFCRSVTHLRWMW